MTLEELVNSALENVHERDGGEYFTDCPFCDDQKMRFGVNVQTGVAHCFKCDFSSGDKKSIVNSRRRTFNAICEITNTEAQFHLAPGEVDVTVEVKEQQLVANAPKIEIKLPKAYEPLWKGINDNVGKSARKYLYNRRITDVQIRDHKIGFCAVGLFASRIVFPVTYRGKLQGYVTRDFTGKQEPKYLNSRGDKGLYNLKSRARRSEKGIIVEGCFDVLGIERASIQGWDTIGTLGSKLPPKHLKHLRTYKELCIWTEPDRAGVEGAISKAKQLQRKHRKVTVILPLQDIEQDTDPGDMSVEEIRERFDERVEYSKLVASLMRTRIAFSAPVKKKKQYKIKKPANV